MVTHHSDGRPVWSHWMVWLDHVLSPGASVMEVVGVVITPIVISATVITALSTGVAVTV